MIVTPSKIPDILVIQPKIFSDSRGFFMESFNQEKYKMAGIDIPFIQDNHSGSKKGVLRGLHYQIKHPQGKLVSVIRGQVFDVAVDLRQGSPFFGQYVAEILSDENRKQLWIPPGFAHGFYVLSDWAEFIYKITDRYVPEFERTIAWNDPTLDIKWPIAEDAELIISEKDSQGAFFKDAEIYSSPGR